MTPIRAYRMWTTGTFEVTTSVSLDRRKSYLVTGYLTLTEGSEYAHIYISTVCHVSGDQVLCGVRDVSSDFDLRVTELLCSASSVTIKLKTKGGRHRAEGVVYEL